MVADDLVYLVGSGTWQLVDASDPVHPISRGRFMKRYQGGMQVVDRRVYYTATGALLIWQVCRDAASAIIPPSGGSLENCSGSVGISFPPGSVAEPMTLRYTGLVTPTHTLGMARPVRSFALEAFSADGAMVKALPLSFTVTITRTGRAFLGIGGAASSMDLAIWSGDHWRVLPARPALTARRISAETNVFSEMVLAGGWQRMRLPLVRR
jgi:hypothetical protein